VVVTGWGALLSPMLLLCAPLQLYTMEPEYFSRYTTCRRTEVPFPAGTRGSSLLHNIQTGSEAHPVSYPVSIGGGGSLTRDKAAGALKWPFSREVKKMAKHFTYEDWIVKPCSSETAKRFVEIYHLHRQSKSTQASIRAWSLFHLEGGGVVQLLCQELGLYRNGSMVHDWWIREDLEGNGRGLTELTVVWWNRGKPRKITITALFATCFFLETITSLRTTRC
jgi:hypothetical protein